MSSSKNKKFTVGAYKPQVLRRQSYTERSTIRDTVCCYVLIIFSLIVGFEM